MKPTNTIKALRDALTDERTWLEDQRKSISKGNGSSWDMMQCSERINLINAALTADASEDAPQAGWVDKFGNVFPLGAYSANGKPNYHDAHKRGWMPLYRHAARPAPVAATPAPDAMYEALFNFAIKVASANPQAMTALGELVAEANKLFEHYPLIAIDAAPAAPIAEVTGQTDRMTERKTNHIMERDGFQKVGYVLQKPGGDYCLSAQSAVRWLGQKQYWRLMHEQDNSLFGTREPTDEERHEAAVEAWLGPVEHAKPEPVEQAVMGAQAMLATRWDTKPTRANAGPVPGDMPIDRLIAAAPLPQYPVAHANLAEGAIIDSTELFNVTTDSFNRGWEAGYRAGQQAGAVDGELPDFGPLYSTRQNAKRYEYVRKLHPTDFAMLYSQNIAGQGRFDDLVDQAIAALQPEGDKA